MEELKAAGLTMDIDSEVTQFVEFSYQTQTVTSSLNESMCDYNMALIQTHSSN